MVKIQHNPITVVFLPLEQAVLARVVTVSPLLAGYLLGVSSFGWPLLIAGALKIIYDLLLLATFHKVRPPEEREIAE